MVDKGGVTVRHTSTKRSQSLEFPPRVGVLDALANQSSDFTSDDKHHDCEDDFVDVDLVGPDVVDGDWDNGA